MKIADVPVEVPKVNEFDAVDLKVDHELKISSTEKNIGRHGKYEKSPENVARVANDLKSEKIALDVEWPPKDLDGKAVDAVMCDESLKVAKVRDVDKTVVVLKKANDLAMVKMKVDEEV